MKTVKAVYIGTQQGTAHCPSFELFNLLEEVDGHPVGSTVSGRTIARLGYVIQPTCGYCREWMEPIIHRGSFAWPECWWWECEQCEARTEPQ